MSTFAPVTDGPVFLRAYAVEHSPEYDDAAYLVAVARFGPGSDEASTLHPICYIAEDTAEAIMRDADRLWHEHADSPEGSPEAHEGDRHVAGCPVCEGWYS
jgi:hypothetical protein